MAGVGPAAFASREVVFDGTNADSRFPDQHVVNGLSRLYDGAFSGPVERTVATPMSHNPWPAILLFGAPGVGKGTNGRVLGSILGFHHLSSGEIFRALDAESPEGREAAACSSRGELVPDDLTIRIFDAVLSEMIARGEYHPEDDVLVLDGIPRTVRQAEMLSDSVDVLAVVSFQFADEDVMVERIRRRAVLENRADDADEETIRRRFEIYRRETEPVLRCYGETRVHAINAEGSPMRVARDLLDALIPAIENR